MELPPGRMVFCDRRTPWGQAGTVRSAFDDILKTLQTPLQVRTPKAATFDSLGLTLSHLRRPEVVLQGVLLLLCRALECCDDEYPIS